MTWLERSERGRLIGSTDKGKTLAFVGHLLLVAVLSFPSHVPNSNANSSTAVLTAVPFYRWTEPRPKEMSSLLNIGMSPKPEFFPVF